MTILVLVSSSQEAGDGKPNGPADDPATPPSSEPERTSKWPGKGRLSPGRVLIILKDREPQKDWEALEGTLDEHGTFTATRRLRLGPAYSGLPFVREDEVEKIVIPEELREPGD